MGFLVFCEVVAKRKSHDLFMCNGLDVNNVRTSDESYDVINNLLGCTRLFSDYRDVKVLHVH